MHEQMGANIGPIYQSVLQIVKQRSIQQKLTAKEYRPVRAVSAIPGRVRLHADRAYRKRLALIADYALALPGVTEASINTSADSVLVRWNTCEAALPEMVKLLEAVPLCAQPLPAAECNGHTPAASALAAIKSQLPTVTSPYSGMAAGTPLTARKSAHQADPDKHGIQVKHFFPGRIHLQVPRLSGKKYLADQFEQIVSKQPGVTRVETNTDGGHVIVHYDSKVHESTEILAYLRTALNQSLHAISRSTTDNPRAIEARKATKAAKVIKEQTVAPRSLIFPAIAVGVAAAGAALPLPVMVGALVVASIPTVAGALDGLRQRRINAAELDFAAMVIRSAPGLMRKLSPAL